MATGIISSGNATTPSVSITYTPASNGKVNVSLMTSSATNYFQINGVTVWTTPSSYLGTNFSFYVSAGTTYTFTIYYTSYIISAIEETS